MYYVYEYVRLDNNTTFYVGKGKGNRAYKTKKRGKHFDNIFNKTDIAVVIVAENLTEQEAFDLEIKTIYDYVFNEGYGINIKGIGYESGFPYLINRTWGGEGFGGINPYSYAESKEKYDKWRKNISKGLINSYDEERGKRMKEAQNRPEVKRKISVAQSRAMKNMSDFYSQLRKELTGEKSSNKRKVYVYDSCMNKIKEFKLIKDCAEYYNVSLSFLWKRDKDRKPYIPPNNFKKKHSHIEGLIFEIAAKW